MANFKKQLQEIIEQIKEQNPEADVTLNQGLRLTVNGTGIDVDAVEITPKEKDDDKTQMNKMLILFKTKEGYVTIAEINDNEIQMDYEAMKEAGLDKRIKLTGEDKIELAEKDEKNLDKEEEQVDEEKAEDEKADEEKPDLEEQDEIKAELAQQYNINTNQIVHISKDKKVTREHRFDGLANFAKDYDDIYMLQGDDPYTWKTIGVKGGEKQEIENETFKQMAGKNPDITIKRIDGEKTTKIRPLAMYEIDNNTAVAIVKNQYGQPEALYCRQEEGKEKEYWGSIIPEASGKNVLQKDPETREFMSYKNNSNRDLAKKSAELEIATDMDERGVPSKEEGVQTYEIDGTSEQNRQLRIEKIEEDLIKKDKLLNRLTAQPEFYRYKAEKVLKYIEENEGIRYEEAIERVEEQMEGDREEGGITPDQGSPLDRR